MQEVRTLPMRLLVITDLHGRREALERIAAQTGPVHSLLFGGDITHFGSPVDADRVLDLASQIAPHVLAVTGNCDSAAIERRLEQRGVALHGRGMCFGSVGIHGVSGIPPWKRGMFQYTEEELAAALQAGYAALEGAAKRILLAHVPPHGLKLDRTYFWKHAGSTAVRAFVDQCQPDLVLCGHIHEGRGIEVVGRTTVVNCGFGARGHYALVEADDEHLHVELGDARL